MKMKTLELKDITLDSVKHSKFGCMNCLWASIECKEYKNFKPQIYNGIPTCEGYTYYD